MSEIDYPVTTVSKYILGLLLISPSIVIVGTVMMDSFVRNVISDTTSWILVPVFVPSLFVTGVVLDWLGVVPLVVESNENQS